MTANWHNNLGNGQRTGSWNKETGIGTIGNTATYGFEAVSTVTPDPKRHMSVTTPSTVSGSETTPVAPVEPVEPVQPVDLFGDVGTPSAEPNAVVTADTHMDESPGQVATQYM